MSLTALFRRRRSGWRWLRAVVEELRGIRLALEHGNALIAATHPGVQQALEGKEPEPESSATYVDPFIIAKVEQEQARIFEATGMLRDQDLVYEQLLREGRLES